MTGATPILWWAWYHKRYDGYFLKFTATILCPRNFPNDFLTPSCWTVVCVAHRRTNERPQSATQPTFLHISLTYFPFSYNFRWVHFSWRWLVAYSVHGVHASFMYAPVGPLEWGQRLSFLINLFPDSSVYWTLLMYHFVLQRWFFFKNENI